MSVSILSFLRCRFTFLLLNCFFRNTIAAQTSLPLVNFLFSLVSPCWGLISILDDKINKGTVVFISNRPPGYKLLIFILLYEFQ